MINKIFFSILFFKKRFPKFLVYKRVFLKEKVEDLQEHVISS